MLFANTDTIFVNDDIMACQEALDDNDKLGLVSMRMKDIHGNEEEQRGNINHLRNIYYHLFGFICIEHIKMIDISIMIKL